MHCAEDSIAGTTSVKRSLASFWAQGIQESDLDILVPCRPQALGAGGSNTEIGCRPPAFEVLQAATGMQLLRLTSCVAKTPFLNLTDIPVVRSLQSPTCWQL